MKKTFIFGLLAAVLGFSSCCDGDSISGGTDDDVKDVPVAGITLNVPALELTLGDDPAQATTTLTATIVPENATNKAVTWSSSDENVATVTAEGIVTAVNEGTATITATAKDGSGKTATCTVTVVKAAPATKGMAKATINGSEVDVNWVQLWADGPKFAEYNVGVTDGKAESDGGYYRWGGSIDKDPGAYNRGTDALTGDDDTATKLWGSAWRMPTKAELEALLANCDVEWTAVNGVNGRKFTGKGDYASNSVFLPAAGLFVDVVLGHGDFSFYWSSTPDGSDYSYDLFFNSSGQSVRSDSRPQSYSVRAVLAE